MGFVLNLQGTEDPTGSSVQAAASTGGITNSSLSLLTCLSSTSAFLC